MINKFKRTRQFILQVFFSFKEGKWDFKRFMGAGGMPSSHSAVVVSLATLIGKYVVLTGTIKYVTAFIIWSFCIIMIKRLRQHFLDISAVDLILGQCVEGIGISRVLLQVIRDLGNTSQIGNLDKLFRLQKLGLHSAYLCYDPAVFK